VDLNNPLDTIPEDDPKPFPYCGPTKDRPRLNFNTSGCLDGSRKKFQSKSAEIFINSIKTPFLFMSS